MTTHARRLRRNSFDSVADTYDRGRPSYPEQLVTDLLDLANIGEGSDVLASPNCAPGAFPGKHLISCLVGSAFPTQRQAVPEPPDLVASFGQTRGDFRPRSFGT